MDTHLNFTDPNSTNKEVVFLRALTDSVRDLHMGSIYMGSIYWSCGWPGLAVQGR